MGVGVKPCSLRSFHGHNTESDDEKTSGMYLRPVADSLLEFMPVDHPVRVQKSTTGR
jgi:hypothetical protein